MRPTLRRSFHPAAKAAAHSAQQTVTASAVATFPVGAPPPGAQATFAGGVALTSTKRRRFVVERQVGAVVRGSAPEQSNSAVVLTCVVQFEGGGAPHEHAVQSRVSFALR